jgi:hypothetical protein
MLREFTQLPTPGTGYEREVPLLSICHSPSVI